ncbi:MAG: hypothetical protein WBM64_04375 [Woeseiaceae bacterium]
MMFYKQLLLIGLITLSSAGCAEETGEPDEGSTPPSFDSIASDGGFTETGVAVVKIADHEWRIEGRCELEGDDLTFIGLGDPMLSIGVNPKRDPAASGTVSSANEGFGIRIGSSEAPNPTVTMAKNSITVSGRYLVEGNDIGWNIEIRCEQ